MIKDDLDALPMTSRRRLLIALEYGIPQFVELPNGRFIGVNVNAIKHLQVTESSGAWAIGKVKGKDSGH